jgi:hypothetical protein
MRAKNSDGETAICVLQDQGSDGVIFDMTHSVWFGLRRVSTVVLSMRGFAIPPNGPNPGSPSHRT